MFRRSAGCRGWFVDRQSQICTQSGDSGFLAVGRQLHRVTKSHFTNPQKMHLQWCMAWIPGLSRQRKYDTSYWAKRGFSCSVIRLIRLTQWTVTIINLYNLLYFIRHLFAHCSIDLIIAQQYLVFTARSNFFSYQYLRRHRKHMEAIFISNLPFIFFNSC